MRSTLGALGILSLMAAALWLLSRGPDPPLPERFKAYPIPTPIASAGERAGDLPPEYWSEKFVDIEKKVDDQGISFNKKLKDVHKDVNRVRKQVEEIRLQQNSFSRQLDQLGYKVEE